MNELKIIKHDIAGDVMSAVLLIDADPPAVDSWRMFTVLKVGHKYRVAQCEPDTGGLIWQFRTRDLRMKTDSLAELPFVIYDFLTTPAQRERWAQ